MTDGRKVWHTIQAQRGGEGEWEDFWSLAWPTPERRAEALAIFREPEPPTELHPMPPGTLYRMVERIERVLAEGE